MTEFQELPFQTLSKVKELKTDQNNCILYKTKVETKSGECKSIVIKELQEDSYMYENYTGNTLTDKANQMSKLFSIIKEHMGEVVVDTAIVVARGHDDKDHIMLIQEEINGQSFDINSPFWLNFERNQGKELQKKLNEALTDPRLIGLEEAVKWVRNDAIGASKNVMFAPDGSPRLIDVL